MEDKKINEQPKEVWVKPEITLIATKNDILGTGDFGPDLSAQLS
jgi:hypothetical protein